MNYKNFSNTIGIIIILMIGSIIALMKYVFSWSSHNLERIPDKCIMIYYPHTSIIDVVCLFTMKYKYRMNVCFLGKLKHYLRKWYSPFLRAFCPNIIPVDDPNTKALVECKKINTNSIIMIAPEGTRKYTAFWRKGFYYISLQTGLPIVFNFPSFKEYMVYHSDPIYAKDHTLEEIIKMAQQFYSKYDLTDVIVPKNVGKIALKE